MPQTPKTVDTRKPSLSKAHIDLPPRSIIKCKREAFQQLPPNRQSLVSGMVNRPLNHLSDQSSTDEWMFLGSSENRGTANALATNITLKSGLQVELAQDPLLRGLAWFLGTGLTALMLAGGSASLLIADQLILSLTSLALATPLFFIGLLHLRRAIRSKSVMTHAQKLLTAEAMTSERHPAVVASLNEAANARIRIAGLDLPSIIDSDMRGIVNEVEHELLQLQRRHQSSQALPALSAPSEDPDAIKIEQKCKDLDRKVKAAIKQASDLTRH